MLVTLHSLFTYYVVTTGHQSDVSYAQFPVYVVRSNYRPPSDVSYAPFPVYVVRSNYRPPK